MSKSQQRARARARALALDGRRVPWASHAEWVRVYHALYAFDITAVRRVKAWASRQKLPLSVDVTATFVEITIRDRAAHISEHELRLMYSMAFIRFVNGVVDTEQRGEFAGSVANIAANMGLPAWFVDLRHSGTHDKLPAIAILRTACSQALEWLDLNYWQMQLDYFNVTGDTVYSLLREHASLHSPSPSSELNDISDRPDGAASIRKITSDIVGCIRGEDYSRFLIPNLLMDGILVPQNESLHSSPDTVTLLDFVQRNWQDSLRTFANVWPSFAQDLVVAIINVLQAADGTVTQNNENNKPLSYYATLAAWARYLLNERILNSKSVLAPKSNTERSDSASESEGDDRDVELSKAGMSDLAVESIVEACLLKPNIFTGRILSDIINSPSQSPEVKEYLQPLVTFMQAKFDGLQVDSEQVHPTPTPNTDSIAEEHLSAHFKDSLASERATIEERIHSLKKHSAPQQPKGLHSPGEQFDAVGGDKVKQRGWHLASDEDGDGEKSRDGRQWHLLPVGCSLGARPDRGSDESDALDLPEALALDPAVDDTALAITCGILVYPAASDGNSAAFAPLASPTAVSSVQHETPGAVDGDLKTTKKKRIRLL